LVAAKESQPDLILLDVAMPIMDGMAALNELKNNPATKNLKVAFLTNLSAAQQTKIEPKFAKEMGAVTVISKDAGMDEFMKAVEELLPG